MLVHQKEEEIKPFSQLAASRLRLNKATTMGVVIDCSGIYHDETMKQYTVKISLIDETLNASVFNSRELSNDLLVYFNYEDPQKMPKPAQLGDILYIKRFKIGRNHGQLRAYSYEFDFCQWALFDCQSDKITQPYSMSRKQPNFKEFQTNQLKAALPRLRHFSHTFLSQYSLLKLLPNRQKYSDKDYIVRMVQQTPQGILVNDGVRDILLPKVRSKGPFGGFAKLRSVTGLAQKKDYLQASLTKYSSLIPIALHTLDSKHFNKASELSQKLPEPVYKLKELLSMSVMDCLKKKFKVNVQIASITPDNFQEALKYYHRGSNTLADLKPSETIAMHFQEPFKPIYDVTLVCFDAANIIGQHTKFYEVKLFSEGNANRQCRNFVPRVDLAELNEYSSYVQENFFYKQQIEALQNASSVDLLIEVLIDEEFQNRVLTLSGVLRIYGE